MGMAPHPDAALLPGVPLSSLNHAFSPFGGATGYDPVSGHVHVRHGFNAYIKCSGNNIYVAFRGTDTGHWGVLVPNVLTDIFQLYSCCLLYTSDAADDLICVDLGGSRITKKKKKIKTRYLSVIYQDNTR